jgi:formiminotetrahydrofolate cyclodeaminase
MRLSALGLTHAEAVAAHGHRAAASDIGVAVALLRAGVHGARLNVDINLAGLSDAAYRDAVGVEVQRLTRGADESAAAAERSLGQG